MFQEQTSFLFPWSLRPPGKEELLEVKWGVAPSREAGLVHGEPQMSITSSEPRDRHLRNLLEPSLHWSPHFLNLCFDFVTWIYHHSLSEKLFHLLTLSILFALKVHFQTFRKEPWLESPNVLKFMLTWSPSSIISLSSVIPPLNLRVYILKS